MKRVILTGADEASYRTATQRSSRPLAFPDGIARYITLTAWQWQVFDWLENESGLYAQGEIAHRCYASASRWCPESVLRFVQPAGWERRPVVAFNEAAGVPVDESRWAFRQNAEDATTQAHHFFERELRKHIARTLSIWMYDRMGFRLRATANDPVGSLEASLDDQKS